MDTPHNSRPFSPPPTASSHPSAASSSNPPFITHKSHRLRTSPVIGEGSTFVPVVKFSSSFTQRNTLRGTKPIYGVAQVEKPHEGDIVSVSQATEGRPVDARTHGWTISITSSNHSDEDLQIEVQQHFEPAVQSRNVQQSRPHEQPHGLPGGALPRREVIQPKLPPTFVPQIPILSHDRVVITEDDLSKVRVKCLSVLILGVLFPPLWVLMGWGHVLDRVLLPMGYQTNQFQQQQILQVYQPYRRVAGVLAGIVVLGTFVGIIVGAVALAGIV
jgi:hypothetical protein